MAYSLLYQVLFSNCLYNCFSLNVNAKVQIEEKDVENTIISLEEVNDEGSNSLERNDLDMELKADTKNVQENTTLHNSTHKPINKKSKTYISIWKQILINLLKNPVEWGIIFGFFFSLTTIGPRFLNPKSNEFIPSLQWVNDSLAWLGECVTPVSLVATGVWMHTKGSSKLFGIEPFKMFLYMVSKCFIVPLIMVGLAILMDLNNEASRAAVLISCLPISVASFSLGQRYEVGEDDLAANVAIGTILMLPTILLWNLALDQIGLFPLLHVSN